MSEIDRAILKYDRKVQIKRIDRQIKALKIVLVICFAVAIACSAMMIRAAKNTTHYGRKEVSQIPVVIEEQKARQI